MEDIQKRLEEASENCLNAYGRWAEKKKDQGSQEALHAAIHELRKVSSRLEIELAVSERDQMASEPLPIPSHRSTSKNTSTPILDGAVEGDNVAAPVVQTKPSTRRRRSPRKPGGAEQNS